MRLDQPECWKDRLHLEGLEEELSLEEHKHGHSNIHLPYILLLELEHPEAEESGQEREVDQ